LVVDGVCGPITFSSLHHSPIKRGAHGKEVERLQKLLNERGATPALVVDGSFGPMTCAAVRFFQAEHNLVIDGVVGTITWESLHAYHVGAKGSDVEDLQKKLKEKGYDVVVDGIFGQQTDAAVRKWQGDHKLVVDGVVGSITWSSLHPLHVSSKHPHHIERMQEILNKRGADLELDGIFGPKTEAAVKKYQKDKGLVVDGIVGPLTYWSLHTLADGDSGPEVKILQRLLNHKGFTLVVDGIFGAKTGAAVKKYQGDHSLVVDGICGPITYHSLKL